MWIIRLALHRPYSFIVLALLIPLMSAAVTLRTPTDVFSHINFPLMSVAWANAVLNPEDIAPRLTMPYEKAMTTLVGNIKHIGSTSSNSVSVIKICLRLGAGLDLANAQGLAVGQYSLSAISVWPHRQLEDDSVPERIHKPIDLLYTQVGSAGTIHPTNPATLGRA
jgi:multidrug efflux pump subunit AcrB